MIKTASNSLISRESTYYAGILRNAPPETPDPYFANVSFLHGGEALSPDVKGNVVTATGNFAVSATRSKFGVDSLYSDGTGDKGSIAASTAFDFGTGDFTVEGWFYQTAVNAYAGALELGINTQAGGCLFIVGDAGNAKIYSNGFYGSKATALNVWQHIVWQRYSGNFNVAVDGFFGTAAAFTANLYHGNNLTIGATSATTYCFPGYIDELRVTKGVARYTTGNFTPPTARFPRS